MVRHLPLFTFLIWTPVPAASTIVQRRDGWVSQANWTAAALLAVLPPAMVRHLPLFTFTRWATSPTFSRPTPSPAMARFLSVAVAAGAAVPGEPNAAKVVTRIARIVVARA